METESSLPCSYSQPLVYVVVQMNPITNISACL
jgi:hypothetical protein